MIPLSSAAHDRAVLALRRLVEGAPCMCGAGLHCTYAAKAPGKLAAIAHGWCKKCDLFVRYRRGYTFKDFLTAAEFATDSALWA